MFHDLHLGLCYDRFSDLIGVLVGHILDILVTASGLGDLVDNSTSHEALGLVSPAARSGRFLAVVSSLIRIFNIRGGRLYLRRLISVFGSEYRVSIHVNR